MKLRNTVVAGLIAVAAGTLIVAGAFGQERVITEEILVQDPTVPALDKWLVGVSGEIWYINGPLRSRGGRAKGTITGTLPGGSLYVGKGNWTLMASFKKGDFDKDLTFVDGFSTKAVEDLQTFDVRLRYMFRDARILGAVPYVMVGYNRTETDVDTTVSPGFIFVATGTPNLKVDTRYNMAAGGIGVLVPFGDGRFGVRADVTGLVGQGDDEIKNALPGVDVEDSGIAYGGVGHVTAYYNIGGGFNIQAGAKGTHFEGSGGVRSFSRLGVFGMVGFVHRF